MRSKMIATTVFFILLVVVAHGAEMPLPRVKIEILSAKFLKDRITVHYKILNETKDDIYFVIPDPDATPINNWPKVPFIKFSKKTGTLEISSYIAELPKDRLIEAPYYHPIQKLSFGEYSGHIDLTTPIFEFEPYSQENPQLVNVEYIKRIRMTIGFIPCDEAGRIGQSIGKSEKYKYLTAVSVIDCKGEKKTVIDFQRKASCELQIQ